MTKEEKENWILDKFIINYNKELNTDFKLSHRISQNEYPGPDFIIYNPMQDRKGIEVTELLEYPAENSGHQKHLEKCLRKLLESKIDKDKLKDYCLTFHHTEYPNEKDLESYADMVLREINQELTSRECEIQKGIIHSIIVGSQVISICKKADDGTGPSFLFFMFGEEGVTDYDKKNFFKGLEVRINEKNLAGKKYNKEQMNALAIYDNTKYSMFINNMRKDIFDELEVINSKEFKEIWLLTGSGEKVFRIDSRN